MASKQEMDGLGIKTWFSTTPSNNNNNDKETQNDLISHAENEGPEKASQHRRAFSWDLVKKDMPERTSPTMAPTTWTTTSIPANTPPSPTRTPPSPHSLSSAILIPPEGPILLRSSPSHSSPSSRPNSLKEQELEDLYLQGKYLAAPPPSSSNAPSPSLVRCSTPTKVVAYKPKPIVTKTKDHSRSSPEMITGSRKASRESPKSTRKGVEYLLREDTDQLNRELEAILTEIADLEPALRGRVETDVEDEMARVKGAVLCFEKNKFESKPVDVMRVVARRTSSGSQRFKF